MTFIAHEREARVSAMFRGGRAKYTESPLEMGHAGDTSHWHNTPVHKQRQQRGFERPRRTKYAAGAR